MNHAFRSKDLPLTTQAAEGLMRRRWSVAEVEAMARSGVVDEDERFELIGGEIVPMNPKGIQHEVLKTSLNLFFARNIPDAIRFAPETTFRLSDDSFVEPDFVFFRKSDGLAGLSPSTALLAVEVSDSSLRWDLGRKARIYADFRVPELWVVDALGRKVHVHVRPGMEGYASIKEFAADETVSSSAVPGLGLNLSQLETF